MRAGHFFANGMRRKFNVLLAKEAGHFQRIRFAQDDDLLTLWTGNFLSEVTIINRMCTPQAGQDIFRNLAAFALRPSSESQITAA